MFNLTKRQILCFGGGALIGVPFFFLLRGSLGASSAAILMVIAMLPMFVLGLYERNGQPLEKALGNIIQTMFLRPKQRPYQTDNLYAALMRQERLEREVRSIVRKDKTKAHA